MPKRRWHHTAEARARIGAAAKARGSARIALAASNKKLKGSFKTPEQMKKVSDGLKRAWAEGRIKPRSKIFTAEEQRAKRLAYSHARYVANRERLLREQKLWHAAHPERKREINQRYTNKNREALNTKQREIYKTPERKAFMQKYAKKHRSENRELYLTYTHNRRALLLGADGSHADDEWRAKVDEYRGCCAYCGVARKLFRDHDVPLARGGSNFIYNILPACGSCNSAKGTLTAAEYRARLVGGARIDGAWSERLEFARAAYRAKRRSP